MQGEGPTLGRPVAFLRLGACNQHCSFCDTPYTWQWDKYDADLELEELTVSQAVARVAKHCSTGGSARYNFIDTLVVSGGEPMMQQRALVPLFVQLEGLWLRRIEIETAGTIAPSEVLVSDTAVHFNVSPKLENSGNPKAQRYRPKAIDALEATGRAVWKFVVVEESDFEEIDSIVKTHSLERVFIMPEGKEADAVNEHAQAIAAATLHRGYHLTTRLHVLLYGNVRGV